MDTVISKIIETESEFALIDQLYQETFTTAAVPTAVQKAWWKAYPKGIIGLFENQTLAGALSYWPITEQSFHAFSSALIPEKQIEVCAESSFYYLSEIVISPNFVGRGLARKLMQYFKDNFPENDTAIAIAYSSGGSHLLTSIGFGKVKDKIEMPDGQDLYLLRP